MPTVQSDWKSTIKGYEDYLRLEKGLSENSIAAYLRDIRQFSKFCLEEQSIPHPGELVTNAVQQYMQHLYDREIARNSQARMLSGIRSFSKYLRLENIIETDPVELVSSPRPERKLPDVLSIEEVNRIISTVDLSRREGVRNKAMLEVLYSCGLRVTELC